LSQFVIQGKANFVLYVRLYSTVMVSYELLCSEVYWREGGGSFIISLFRLLGISSCMFSYCENISSALVLH